MLAGVVTELAVILTLSLCIKPLIRLPDKVVFEFDFKVILPSEIVASDKPYVDFSLAKTSLIVELLVIPLSAEPLTLKSVTPN